MMVISGGGKCLGLPFAFRVCVSTTKQVLPWHLVTGQSRHHKTPGSFVGPLSDLIVSDESALETAQWLVSRTLTNLLSLLGFTM